jgi:hypothetical protein
MGPGLYGRDDTDMCGVPVLTLWDAHPMVFCYIAWRMHMRRSRLHT